MSTYIHTYENLLLPILSLAVVIAFLVYIIPT